MVKRSHMFNKIASISHILRSHSITTGKLVYNQYLPSLCALCKQYHRNQHAICTTCYALFIPLGPACHYCAIPMADKQSLICGACCVNKPEVNRVVASYQFEEPLRTLLHTFKYHQGLYLTSLFTDLMLKKFEPNDTQCLIPIPMHPKRLQQRGFNQAVILAKQLSKRLGLPCEINICKKIINTQPQAGLSKHLRASNLINAFTAKPLTYQHVTLVDDLFTTGNTANEIARTLKRRGVAHVDVWCCARTVADSNW